MLIIHADGGCSPNPGEGTIGIVAFHGGARIHTYAERIGQATNNIAEWRALIAALEFAQSGDWQEVHIRMDSQLVVNQINGRWRIKDGGLKPWALQAGIVRQELVDKGVRVVVSWVPRLENAQADRAASGVRV